MKLIRRRKSRPVDVRGTARVDRRTKNLTRRLVAGDIAVIDHPDIDRVAADTRERIGAWNALGSQLCGAFLEAAERLAVVAR